MSRTGFVNQVLDWAVEGTNWTRDVPAGFLAEAFPSRDHAGNLRVVPAKESNNGRGAPFFDVYHSDISGLEIAISMKISHSKKSDRRAPRTSVIAGSKTSHLFGLYLAAQQGRYLPVVNYWQDVDGSWYRLAFDAGRILRGENPTLTQGWIGLNFDHAVQTVAELREVFPGVRQALRRNDGGVLAISPLKRESGGRPCAYLNAKVNHGAAGLSWVACDSPRMPDSLTELLAWMGEIDEEDMIG